MGWASSLYVIDDEAEMLKLDDLAMNKWISRITKYSLTLNMFPDFP